MALIGTIRKNFWFVLILLGLALAAFILMDMTSAGNAGGAPTSLTMGSVGGKKIDYRAFQQTESAYYGSAQGDPFSKRKTIWDFYVQKALVEDEASDLGLTISKEELMDLQFGANQSEIVQNNWRNPQTGQIDQATLQQFKTAIEGGEEMNPQFRAYWAEQEKQIIKDQLETKLNTLVSKAVYTPNWMAEEAFNMDNTKVDFNYVKIPFDRIDGAGITASDADITNYIASNKNKYLVSEETRVIEYAVFNVTPSAKDSADMREEMNVMKNEFINSAEDSLFVLGKNGSYSHLYGTSDQMPASARSQIQALSPGQVHGPFVDNGFYLLVKMLDKRTYPDTVEARHILKAATAGDANSMASARASIDSIRRAYRSGTSFDTLALRHSDDPSNKATGGALPRFTQQTMVPEFATASFQGKVGGLYTVETQFGVHLLEVLDQVYNDDNLKYRVATVGKPVIPSQETQDAEYDKVTEVISSNRELLDLRTAIEGMPNVTIEKSAPLRQNDFTFGTLGATQSAREMIKWAFDPSAEVGDVSPEIYRFTDQVQYYDNKYVLGGLNSIVGAGLPPASSMRASLETTVLNNLKATKFAEGFSYSSIQEAATAQGVQMQTANDIGSKASLITGIGKEPKVLAAAHSLGVQEVSKPIVGESGVFVIQPISKQEAGAATNLPLLKSNLANTTKSQVDFNLIKNMTKRADVKDDRTTFF